MGFAGVGLPYSARWGAGKEKPRRQWALRGWLAEEGNVIQSQTPHSSMLVMIFFRRS